MVIGFLPWSTAEVRGALTMHCLAQDAAMQRVGLHGLRFDELKPFIAVRTFRVR
ncbi:hypothetical protein ACJJWD_08865 [Comamonas testosteroni]